METYSFVVWWRGIGDSRLIQYQRVCLDMSALIVISGIPSNFFKYLKVFIKRIDFKNTFHSFTVDEERE